MLSGLLSVPAIVRALEHEDILSVSFGGMWQADEYLSPLLYSDFSYGLQNEWWQTFRRDSAWSHTGRAEVRFAQLYPAVHSNYIYALGVTGGWGAQYHFATMMGIKGFDILLGPCLQFDLMAREHASNVNKPYSMDCAIDLCAHAGVRYSFGAKRTSYRLQYEITGGVAGVMFVPEYGQSYYEITEGVVHRNTIFGAWHNRLLFQHQLTLDMQFKHSAWRVGIRHDCLQYHANNLHFMREQAALVVGTVFQYRTTVHRFCE